MTDDDRRTSVDFEPVALRPPRRQRRPDPILIGAVAVVLALVVAVVKPWEGDTTVAIASPQPPPTAEVTVVAVPSFRPLDLTDPADAVTLLSVLAPHPAWGVRVIAHAPEASSASGLVEHWLQAVPTPDGRISPLVLSAVEGIVALGVTAPPVVTPLDVRAWARGLDGQWHWLDVGPVGSDDPATDLLLPPPIADGVALPVWPVGRYRLDLLMGQVAYQLDLTIDPDVSAPDAPVSDWTPGEAVTPGLVTDVPVGAYAVGAYIVAPLGGQPGPRLSDAQAWLATDRAPTAWLPSATGLGVLLPAGASDARGVIRRLAPEPFFLTPDGQIAARTDAGDEPSPYVQFDAPVGTRFEPGVYAMDIDWTDAGRAQQKTWTVTLRPAPNLREAPLLQAARRFRPAAGMDSLILRAPGGSGPDPAGGPVQVFPLADSMGCDDGRTDPSPPVIGLGHGTDIYPRSIVATRMGPDDVDTEIPLRIAPAVVPGLTLIAPADQAAFAPGRYRFTMTEAARPVAFTLCLGAPPYRD